MQSSCPWWRCVFVWKCTNWYVFAWIWSWQVCSTETNCYLSFSSTTCIGFTCSLLVDDIVVAVGVGVIDLREMSLSAPWPWDVYLMKRDLKILVHFFLNHLWITSCYTQSCCIVVRYDSSITNRSFLVWLCCICISHQPSRHHPTCTCLWWNRTSNIPVHAPGTILTLHVLVPV